MKAITKYIIILFTFGAIVACDDQINPTLESAPDILVIDAWINDKPENQIVNISMSSPYLDNDGTIQVLEGAQVYIIDNENTRFDFVGTGSGKYEWSPLTADGFGTVGNDYTLYVNVGGEAYEATSSKNRVPVVDSVNFRYEAEKASFGLPESYFGEFFSRDLLGPGDTYWIKAFKNEEFLGKPSEINVAFDAGFSEGGVIDNIIFIPPIRDAVNQFEEDPDDDTQILSPYADGDTLLVEVHSITIEAFTFLNEVRIQTDRPGGFGELFASPLSNVNSNVTCVSNPDIEVVGFFCVSAVESNGKRLDISTVPKE